MKCANHPEVDAIVECVKCGKQLCDECYAKDKGNAYCFDDYPYKSKDKARKLCFFLGFLGVHRFYVGKKISGIIWMLTLGLIGFGPYIDYMSIHVGMFKDKAGMPLK